MTTRNRPLSIDSYLILLATALLIFTPVAADLIFGDAATPFRYFAADAFYYFTVARNFALSGMMTFDQLHPTNGFHPLWQLLTGYCYRFSLAAGLPETTYLWLMVWLSLLLVTLGVVLAGLSFIKVRHRLPWVFALLPVGVYALAILPAWLYAIDGLGFANRIEGPIPLYGTLWSYVNGMESGLAIFFFGLLFWLYTRPNHAWWHTLLLGLAASLLALARLDHIFMAGGILALLAWQTYQRRTRPAFWRMIIFMATIAGPILVYMAINASYAGTPLPTSGATKTTFPVPNSDHFFHLIWLLYRPFNDPGWLDRFYRLAQILLPCSAAFLAIKRGRSDQIDEFLFAVGIGVLGLAAYNFFFVRFYGPGHWYFPVSILFSSFVAINALDQRPVQLNRDQYRLLATAMMALLVFVFLHKRDGYHDHYIAFYFEEAEKVQAHYQKQAPKVIEFDDGIFAFATGFPTMAGLGFALDKEAFESLEQDRLIELAYERGFDRVTSLGYKNFSQVRAGDPDLAWYIPVEDFEVVQDYSAADRSFGIIKIQQKNRAQAPTEAQLSMKNK